MEGVGASRRPRRPSDTPGRAAARASSRPRAVSPRTGSGTRGRPAGRPRAGVGQLGLGAEIEAQHVLGRRLDAAKVGGGVPAGRGRRARRGRARGASEADPGGQRRASRRITAASIAAGNAGPATSARENVANLGPGTLDVAMILRSRRVVTPDGIRDAAVVVRDGRIDAVLAPSEIGGRRDVTDLGDRVLLPGLVDTHVHVNEPGRTEWEGFATATRAAAAGGVTTLVDMPLNSIPATTTVAALHAKREARARPVRDRRRLLGRRGARQRARAGAAGRGRRARLQVLPGAVGRRRVRARRRARPRARRCRSSRVSMLPCSSTPSGRSRSGGVATGDLARSAASCHLARARGRPRPRSRRSGSCCALSRSHRVSRARRPSLGRGRARGPASRRAARRSDHGRDLPALSALRRRGDPGRRHRLQVRAADPRAHANRERLWQRARRGRDRSDRERPLAVPAGDEAPRAPATSWPRGAASPRSRSALAAVWTEARRRGFAPARRRALDGRATGAARGTRAHGRVASLPGCDADLVAWDPDAEVDGRSGRALPTSSRHAVRPAHARRRGRADVAARSRRARRAATAAPIGARRTRGRPLMIRDGGADTRSR